MANFDTGVKEYIHTSAVVRVDFPVDWRGNAAIACVHCPYLSSNMRMCQLNKAVVDYPEKYIGRECPLTEMNREGEECGNT